MTQTKSTQIGNRQSAIGNDFNRQSEIGNDFKRQSAVGNGLKVSLFVTCLVDQLWGSVGSSAVEVLRRVGCEVEFDERQTCCGQPAFNTGYRKEARQVAEQFIRVFEEHQDQPIVSPSGSCTAMVHHFPELFEDDEGWRKRAEAIAARTHELSSFLVRVLKVEDVGARLERLLNVARRVSRVRI